MRDLDLAVGVRGHVVAHAERLRGRSEPIGIERSGRLGVGDETLDVPGEQIVVTFGIDGDHHRVDLIRDLLGQAAQRNGPVRHRRGTDVRAVGVAEVHGLQAAGLAAELHVGPLVRERRQGGAVDGGAGSRTIPASTRPSTLSTTVVAPAVSLDAGCSSPHDVNADPATAIAAIAAIAAKVPMGAREVRRRSLIGEGLDVGDDVGDLGVGQVVGGHLQRVAVDQVLGGLGDGCGQVRVVGNDRVAVDERDLRAGQPDPAGPAPPPKSWP